MYEDRKAFCMIILVDMIRHGAVVQPAGTAATLHLMIEGTPHDSLFQLFKKMYFAIWKIFFSWGGRSLPILKFRLRTFKKMHRQLFQILQTRITDWRICCSWMSAQSMATVSISSPDWCIPVCLCQGGSWLCFTIGPGAAQVSVVLDYFLSCFVSLMSP